MFQIGDKDSNIQGELKGDILHLQIDLSKEGKLSSTGKSYIIAGTGGFASIEGRKEVISMNLVRSKNGR